jgi:heptosyltransferase-1
LRCVPKRNFKRILIVRLSSLGDVIQTLPIPGVVRAAYPDAELGWAIDRELAPAIAGHPDVDHVHPCDRLHWGQNLKHPFKLRPTARAAMRFIEEIRAVGYDCALDVQGLLKSAVIPFFARIPTRIGFGHRRELSHLFYTERYLNRTEYFDRDRMHVDHMLALANAIGCDTDNYSIQLPPVSAESATKIDVLPAKMGSRETALVALAPATQWSSKEWPFEHWLSLTRMVLARTSANVLLIGAPTDAPVTARLLATLDDTVRHRVLDLAGRTSITELYALLQKVSVMVAADTAPLHIAGAAGCDLVGLFGATPILRTGPMGRGNITLLSLQPQLLCQPCQERVCRYGTTACMRDLQPDVVFNALKLKAAIASFATSQATESITSPR